METDDLTKPDHLDARLRFIVRSPSRSPRLPWNLNSPAFIWSVKYQSGFNICRMPDRSLAGEVRCCRIEERRRNRCGCEAQVLTYQRRTKL